MEQSRAGSMGLSVYEKGHFRVCYHSRLTQPVVFLSLCLWKDLTRPLCTGRVATVRPLNPQPSQHRTTDKSQYFNFNFTHFPHKTYFHINTYRYIYTYISQILLNKRILIFHLWSSSLRNKI